MIDLITGEEIIQKEDDSKTLKEEMKVKKLGPFDIINYMFTNKPIFDRMSDTLLKQHFFMINRTFAIKYPLQAAMFNKMGINEAEVIRFWQYFLTAPSKEGYGRVPQFVYTKRPKIVDPDNLDEETVVNYCKRYNLSKKDFKDMLYFYHDFTVKDVKEFEKRTDKKELAKMFSSEKNKEEKPKKKTTKKKAQ